MMQSQCLCNSFIQSEFFIRQILIASNVNLSLVLRPCYGARSFWVLSPLTKTFAAPNNLSWLLWLCVCVFFCSLGSFVRSIITSWYWCWIRQIEFQSKEANCRCEMFLCELHGIMIEYWLYRTLMFTDKIIDFNYNHYQMHDSHFFSKSKFAFNPVVASM